MALAVVRDLREFRDPVSAEELEQFETDVLAGFAAGGAWAFFLAAVFSHWYRKPESVAAAQRA